MLQSVVEKIFLDLDPDARLSRWYRTEAFPAGSGPDFLNAAIALNSKMNPADLLAHLHAIERDHGRKRTKRWGPRTVDLDLLASGDLVLPDAGTWRHWHDLDPARQSAEWPEDLILPHPRMQDRAFVLVPLMDIAPGWRHPVLRRTVTEMHAELTPEELRGVELLKESGCQ